MKVLVIATWYPTAASPVNGIFVQQQAAALAPSHSVTVLAPEYCSEVKSPQFERHRDGSFTLIRARVPTGRLALVRGYSAAISAITKEVRPDVLHAHVTLPGGAAAAIAARTNRTPLVITEHRSPFSDCMKTFRDRLTVRCAMRSAAAVIAVSTSLRNDIARYGIRRQIDVVPNMFDSSLFTCQPRQLRSGKDHNVLFVGRLSDEQKNLPSLLRALALLRSRGDFLLTIIGEGRLVDDYKDMARSLGIEGACRFVGHQAPHGIRDALARSDVLALPSLHETFGIVLAEALAIGRPVVATDCGGPRDILTPSTGRLVPVNDDVALAEAIHDVCNNPERFKPAALSAYAHQRFSADAVVKQMDQIYNRIVI